MPIHRCTRNGKSGWQWGQSGKCYTGPGARAKAERQARAIRASGYTSNESGKPPSGSANPLRIDPTRTTMLASRFGRAIGSLFDEVYSHVRSVLVDEDAFGIGGPTIDRTQVINTRWAHLDDSAKLREFEEWLRKVYGDALSKREELFRRYVEEGYEKGVGRAFDDVRSKSKALKDSRTYNGEKAEFLRSAFAHPVSVDKLKILVTRSLSEVKGLTDTDRTVLLRILADGLVRGDHPRVIARAIRKQLDVSSRKALTIARTEIVRAHSEGQLYALEALGVQKVGVMVEWVVTKDSRTCPLCNDMAGVVLKIGEARGLIPRHPACRCTWIPANVGEDHKGQKRGKSRIKEAIERSVKREGRDGTWAGSRTRIATKRPRKIRTPRSKT